MNLGLHLIQNSSHPASYFVQRPYGNWILFAENLESFNYSFLKSKGGVYRQLLFSAESISNVHIQLFERFGAHAVFADPNSAVDPRLPCEVFDGQFFDQKIELIHFESGHMVKFKQNKEKIGIFSPELFLNIDDDVIVANQEKTAEIEALCQSHRIERAFFSHFDSDNMLSFSV